jgi:uncharacterized repeat protein (TIGR01451 family)
MVSLLNQFFPSNISILIFLCICGVNTSYSQIVLSEIMFDPSGSEYYDEFIEIYNTSATDSIDLTGWQISDGSGTDLIIAFENGSKLGPQQFALMLDPGYFQNSTQYENQIPEQALVLTIDNNTFGSSGLSNSSSEPVILISHNGETKATYLYSLDNEPGFSDEKIDLLAGDDSENWENSKTLNGTPGFLNSVRKLSTDIFAKLTGTPKTAQPGQTIRLTASITNVGNSPVSNIKVTFFLDKNFDSFLSAEEQIGSPYFITDVLLNEETEQIFFTFDSLVSGRHIFYIIAYLEENLDTLNNVASSEVKIGFPVRSLIINEIMYRPSSNQVEWIELFNPGVQSVDIQQWQFSDANTDSKITMCDSSLLIPGQGYLILAENNTIHTNYADISCDVLVPAQGFPALNNSGDVVSIYDLIGSIIDEVNYQSFWGSESGVSLERISRDKASDLQSNWGLSQNPFGATPGSKNSVSPLDYDLALTEINYTPANPFPENEITFSFSIKNSGLLPVNGFQLTGYFDLNHDEIFQPDEQIGDVFFTETPIKPEEIIQAEILYFISNSGVFNLLGKLQSAEDINPSNDSLISEISVAFPNNVLVINEIMYSPLSEQPEWIEFYNRSDNEIDIQSWAFSDSDTSFKTQITKNYLPVPPKTFIILAQDSTIFNHFNLTNVFLSTPSPWPSLNNSGDRIVLYDQNKNIIDEVSYFDFWGGDNGLSLERINPNLASNDSSNWNTSANIYGATPGDLNSIFVDVLPSGAQLSISPNPFSPDSDGRDDVTIISYELPFNLSQVQIKIYDIRGRLIKVLVNNQPSGVNNSTIWDGKDKNGNICRMGIYIVFLEAIHYQKGVVKSLKESVVLAKKL